MKKYLKLVLLLNFIVCGVVLSQNFDSKKVREAAKDSFMVHNNNAKVNWDFKRGIPSTILIPDSKKKFEDPTETAKQFLSNEKEMFGVKDLKKDLKLGKMKKSNRGNNIVEFEQYVNDIPVYNAGYLFALNEKGQLYFISGEYFPDLIAPKILSLTKKEIYSFLQPEFNKLGIIKYSEPKLYLYPIRDENNLSKFIYEFKVSSDSLYKEDRILIVDAANGKVLESKSLINHAEAQGAVYKTNPLNPQYTQPIRTTLYRLNNLNPLQLDGENVVVRRYGVGVTQAIGGNFIFTTGSLNFKDVMCYYHADQFKTFLIYDVGLPQNKIGKVEIITSDPNEYAVAGGTLIRFGTNYDPYELRDATLDGASIAHEFMHIVTNATNSYMHTNDDSRALNEAYSDYYEVSYLNYNGHITSIASEWNDMPGGLYDYRRNLSNNRTMLDYNRELDGQPPVEEHDRSVIFSGGMWDFRKNINVSAQVVDQIILESLNNLDSYPTFIKAKDAIIATAYSLGHPEYINYVKNAFYTHGIPFPIIATISGPSSLSFKESGLYIASASGGSGNGYSYEWRYRKIYPWGSRPLVKCSLNKSVLY